jgi:F1F0 ATPase subunit 2
MIEGSLLPALVMALTGFGLGLFFYGGLWLTIRVLQTSRRPTLLALGSFWIRTAVVLLGFVLVANYGWRNALICLGGFVIGRVAISRWTPRSPAKRGAT